MNRRDEADMNNASPELAAEAEAVWGVLVVDDEPEVLEVTRLILGRMQFRGRPVLVEGACSAGEARAYLARHPDTAVVLLDVVMEADDAGLQLVRHIREQAGLRQLQIVIRTGQPGVAPEAEVIAAYEINGYYLKTELTAQRLRSVVTFALRNRSMADVDAETGRSLRETAAPAVAGAVLDVVRRAVTTAPLIEPRIHLGSGRVSAYDVRAACVPGLDREQFFAALSELTESERRDCDKRVLDALEHADRTLFTTTVAARLAVRLVSVGSHGDGDDGVAMYERVLARTGLAVGRFELCLSEDDMRHWGARIEGLRRRGVTITLDDVGLRALSLPDIQRLRPDIIALHPAIVAGVHADAEQAAIVRSVIALAHTLGARALARGVASNEDVQFCKWEGCECAQGPALSDATPSTSAPAGPHLH